MKKLSCIFCFTLLLLSACSSQSNRNGVEQDFDQSKAAKTRISLGLTYLKNGNFSQAKYNLDKALQFAPRSADAHFALAYYYQQVEEHEAADKSYQTAMDFDPRNADIANSYGAFLCQRGQYAEAKRYFLKAVNSDNYISSAETYENLALCSQTHGELEDALQYLRSAVNHQPGRARSLYLLAQLLANSNHWAEAKDVLRRYEKVSQVSANSLLLASEVERALGNLKLAKGYGEMLLRMYPSDPATARYLKQSRTVSPKATPLVRKSNKTLVAEPVAVVEIPPGKVAESPVQKAITTETLVTKEADISEEMSVSDAIVEIPAAVTQREPVGDIPEEVSVSEAIVENPAEVTQSELVVDIPEEVPVSEVIVENPTEVTQSELVGDIPQEVPVSEAIVENPAEVTQGGLVEDIPVDATQSAPVVNIPDEVKEFVPAKVTAKDFLEQEITTKQAELVSQDKVSEVIESSPNKDVITHLVEKEQEIEHAEIVVVEKSEPQAEQVPTFHIVQKKENLYRISLLYNIKMQRLIEWNDLPDAASIYIGKKLIIVDPEKQE
jgi:type IV pilus assembly protein PilF